jgi:hypothetical protein
MPDSSWTETGSSISLIPTTTPIDPGSSPANANYLTNAYKAALMQQYAGELAMKTSLDSLATTWGCSATAYNNAVAAINTTITGFSGAPANWATIWPDGTMSGPWMGVQTLLSADWSAIATQRTALQSAISAAQAAAAQAASISAAAADATSKMNSAISTAESAAESYAATQAANAQAAATLASQPHQVSWASTALPSLPSSSYPAGYFALTTDKLTYQVNTAGTAWVQVQYAASGIFGQVTTGQLAAGSVTTGTLAAGAVTTSILAASAVTAANIAAGAVTANRLAIVGGYSACINVDPQIQDQTVWFAESGSITFQTPGDAPVGSTVIRSASGAPTILKDANYYPIDITKTYIVRFWARPSSANGLLYADLQQYLSNSGSTCATNGGRAPYKPSALSLSGLSGWTEYSNTWGPSDWQSGVKFVRLDFLLNYSGSAGYVDVCNVRFEEMTSGSLIVDGSITSSKISAGAITGNMITAGVLTAGVIYFTDGFCLNTLEPKEAGANVTSAHVLTSIANESSTATATGVTHVLIPGLAFSLNTSSTADVYNFFGSMSGAQTAGTVGTDCYVCIYVDGVYNQEALITYPNLGGTVSNFFVMILTGLSAGAHTIQFYMQPSLSTATFQFYPGSSIICQRIF